VACVTDSKNVPAITAFQVATMSVAMAPKISGAGDLICKKSLPKPKELVAKW